MVYLIDMRIKYRTEDGAMWLQDDEGSLIVLTVIMNRLLSYLIEHRAQVVTRDDLLHNIWDLHGLHSSNHTLSKYLSELRKQFRAFGVTTECITTIPRTGFMFNGDVDVEVQQDPMPVTERDADSTGNTGTEKTDVTFLSRRLFTTATIASGILVTGIYLMPAGLLDQENVKIHDKDIPTYLLFSYENCPVYTTQNNSPALSERKKLLFIQLVKEENVTCLNSTSFLYQVSEAYLYGREGRAFISRCTLKGNEYISCLNYYWSGYERKV